MAEDQKPSEPQVTYKGLLEDKDFIDSAYYGLKALGQDIEYDPTKILDSFLTQKRYFDTNLLSTLNTSDKIANMDDTDKLLFAHAYSKIENLPSFFDKEGAPVKSALADYALAAATDPTNIASALASLFTVGTGGEIGRAHV